MCSCIDPLLSKRLSHEFSFWNDLIFQLYYLPLLLVLLLRNSVGNNNEELLWKMNLTPGRHRATTFSSCVNKVEHFIYITGFWGLDGGDGTTLSEVHLTGKLDRDSCFNWFWKISQLSYFQYTDHLSLLVSLTCAWSHLDQLLSFTEFISVSSYQGHFNNTSLPI